MGKGRMNCLNIKGLSYNQILLQKVGDYGIGHIQCNCTVNIAVFEMSSEVIPD